MDADGSRQTRLTNDPGRDLVSAVITRARP